MYIILYNNNTKMQLEIDLDLNNYSLKDLYKLFFIENNTIDLEELKNAKKIVLKMHPDKSKLDAKYFLFFSSAYKKLYSIYEFQNKNINKKLDINEYYKKDNINALDDLFDKKKELKNPKDFNKWFNNEFEKHKIEENNLVNGYGDWLKSDEGIYNTSVNNISTMHEEFEKQKKKIQALSVYNGINDPFSSTLGGSLLGNNNNDNFSSGLFEGNSLQYQDLKQAHVETIIPISNDDYLNIPKFKSEQEYKLYRDKQDINPLNEKEALNKIRYQESQKEEESSNLAYYYAKQSEEVSKKSNNFWSSIKYLTN
jgi:hypothetical protein